MEKQGFTNYPKEWWHFVLKDEPYKSDYFDFEVQ
jgi:D-alanyl-D-alanine dipeptidase